MSVFGDSSTLASLRKLLKTNTVFLATNLHSICESRGESAVIVFLLLAAILILVGVSFISSIDFSDRQRP